MIRSSDEIWQYLWYAFFRRAQLVSYFSQRVTETSTLVYEENKGNHRNSTNYVAVLEKYISKHQGMITRG